MRPALGRRAVLAGCLCCAGAARARAAERPVEQVADGMFFRRGLDEDAQSGNADAIANIGFVVGRESVAVIDPGGSLADGAALHAELRRVTPLPVRFVVLSHVHPDHVFGAGAFLGEHPVFVGHARLPDALSARGAYYQSRLDEALGAGASGPVVMPTLLVADRAVLDLGGRTLAVTAHGPAHTDCDLSLLDSLTGTLLATDLLFVRRIPSLDGSLSGWIKELAGLQALAAPRVVPGHGPLQPDPAPAAAALARYLTALRDGVRAAIAQGVPMQDAAGIVARGERDRWLLWDGYHPRNVLEAYRELQWE